MKSSDSFRLSLLLLCGWMQAFVVHSWAADSNSIPRFDVHGFNVQGYLASDTIAVAPELLPMVLGQTGTNLDVNQIVQAAVNLQTIYARSGHTNVSVAVGAAEMTNGLVTFHVFESAVPQIRIAGKRYLISSNEVEVTDNLLPPPVTNAPVVAVPPLVPTRPSKPPTPEQEALRVKIAQLDDLEKTSQYPPLPPVTTQMIFAKPAIDTNDVHTALRDRMYALSQQNEHELLLPPLTNSVVATNSVASTNHGPVFEVKGYELIGNSLLPANITELVLQPYIGTNVTFEDIRSALKDLQTVYTEHGFATVSVTLPQQTLSDKIVKIRVFEGRLMDVVVVHNHYFSSNNIMRALPSLHPNMILTRPIFESELDRANANQDRQIYPSIEPGFVEGTSELKLDVKDRLPLHAKVELNNQNSPGTPSLRVNSSAEYGNLWQMEHSLGVQYSFSPEQYKKGEQWDFYDKPLVANYSAFYRFPLGNPESVANTISASTRFGYDEGTRRFNLPPPSGQPEINIYASRSTIDTGLETSPEELIFNVPGVRQVIRQDEQQDITVNNAIGAQFTMPLPEVHGIRSTLSLSLNYKTYDLTSAKTNEFRFTEITVNANGTVNPPIISTVSSPVPLTVRSVNYMPITFRYDASEQDKLGFTAFGIGITGNPWFSGSRSNYSNVAASQKAGGHWVTVTPSLSRDIVFPKNWTLSLHIEGQYANEPLISNEQFGSGGVSSVRGYHEGEVFGDTGWRMNGEFKTPVRVVGIAYGKQPLTLRGSAFMDYSQTYLIDTQGRDGMTPLWSAGVGFVAAIGTHWESRFIFAVPFERTATIQPMRPRFNFSLTGQF